MTPTEYQRVLFEHHPPPLRKGLDHWADGMLGRLKRGPWVRARLAAVTVDSPNSFTKAAASSGVPSTRSLSLACSGQSLMISPDAQP